ncbi:MAG TPA: ATP-binding cassette domain-containing protein [Solirubrobacteraceae bacterium]|nr:ATP-binding cassette domain-containing protein [Solirubrobacteraceae bacterium]
MSSRDVHPVRGIDMEVRRREVFPFHGSDGAGKSTTLGVLEGDLKRTGGEVSVLGVDSESAGPDWRGRVGVALQESAVEPDLTVWECLTMYSGYYGWPRSVEELIELLVWRRRRTRFGEVSLAVTAVGWKSGWPSSGILTLSSCMSRRSVSTRRRGVAASGKVGGGGGAVAEREVFWTHALAACD